MFKERGKKIASPTQENLEIAGVEDGIAILRDGSYRLVLEVASTNFELKNEREQNAIIFQFQSFLNSLHFPIQIVTQSRKLDLTPYLTKLKRRAEAQTNELLKIQTLEYIDFISELINLANIMKKRFFVVIGWENTDLPKLSFVDKLLNRGNSVSLLKISEPEFKARSNELRERASLIASGLGSMGLRCRQLTTKELIELYYNLYNPGIADKERLEDLEGLQAAVVTSETPGEFNIEKPHNTSQETPVIDNAEFVREQDRAKREIQAFENKNPVPEQKTATPSANTGITAGNAQNNMPATPPNNQIKQSESK